MDDKKIRKHLTRRLSGKWAHMSLSEAIKNFPEMHLNTKPNNVDYPFWHLLEHIRIAQWDILKFIIYD